MAIFTTASGKDVRISVAKENRLTLSAKELTVANAYLALLDTSSVVPGKQPLAIALVGRIGARRSEVASGIAKALKGSILIRDFSIRCMLKKRLEYLSDSRIAAHVARELLQNGYTAVLSGDHLYAERRIPLGAIAKEVGAGIKFIRVWANDRIFFEKLKNTIHTKRDVLELAEQFHAQTIRHYKMPNGAWELRELPFLTEIGIDTTNWAEDRAQCVLEKIVPLLCA